MSLTHSMNSMKLIVVKGINSLPPVFDVVKLLGSWFAYITTNKDLRVQKGHDNITHYNSFEFVPKASKYTVNTTLPTFP